MTSTTANNNSVASSQPAQFSFNGSKPGSTSPLASLANATEPSGFSFNQQQKPLASLANATEPSGFSFNQQQKPLASLANATEPSGSSFNQQQIPVATFPQRPTGGTPTANTGSPLGTSFSQASTSGPNQPFQFTNPSSTNASNPPFPNLSSANAPRFSFANLQSGNPPFPNLSSADAPRFSFANLQSGNPTNFTFNQPTANSQAQQPLGTFTFTPSTQKQEISNDKSQSSFQLTSTNSPKQISATDEVTQSTAHNTTTFSKKLSDPPTPISEQSSVFNQEQEESDVPASSEENSLVSKKVNTTLRDSNAYVVDRSDPNSPLYSLTTFQELNLKPDLLKGIFNMAFQFPSKIQAIALPSLLDNPPRNIIAQSQSGTGKTAAFSLAIISRIDPSIQSPQALILAPTFELAIQIGSVIEKMAQFLPYIKIAYAVRDPTISKRSNLPRGQLLPEPIVIGTPGTVEEWCLKLRVIDLSRLRVCCVDEADVMIATQNFQDMCIKVVRGLNLSACQVMLFSATYSDEVMGFAREIVPNPVVLRLKREKQTLVNIRQFFIRCYDQQHKYHAIEQIYYHLTLGQAMIFCRTKATARDLAIRLANQQHSVRELTAALDIEQRASVIKQFREGLFRVLISTNVTARGLDVDDVSLVINYDMPVTVTFQPEYETYLHRIGRCGRFGKLGYTFNLIGSEQDFNIMKSIEEYFHHPIDEITIEDISQLEHHDTANL